MQLSYRTLLVALALAACSPPPPVTRPIPQTDVGASFDRTWTALIDFLTASQIPIASTDKASGLATTGAFSIDKWDVQTRLGVAKCGGMASPSSASMTFLVRGDGARSSVRADARFANSTGGECTTTYALERSWEGEVQKKAEQARP